MKVTILFIVAYSFSNVSKVCSLTPYPAEIGRPCLDHKGNLRSFDRIPDNWKARELYLGPDGCNLCSCTSQGNQCLKRKCIKGDACMDRFGKVHQPGEVFRPDPCNRCHCFANSDGTKEEACTKRRCMARRGGLISPGGPEENCRGHKLGETYEAGDGCNLCVCRKAGDDPIFYEKEQRKVFGACTKILCPKQEPLKPKMNGNPDWSPKKEY